MLIGSLHEGVMSKGIVQRLQQRRNRAVGVEMHVKMLYGMDLQCVKSPCRQRERRARRIC